MIAQRLRLSTGEIHRNWHADPVDADDERRLNPGSGDDVSVHLHTFRGGLRGSPLKSDGLDTSRLHPFVFGATGLVFYDVGGKLQHVATAHVSPHNGITFVWKDERFAMVLERWKREVMSVVGTVAA